MADASTRRSVRDSRWFWLAGDGAMAVTGGYLVLITPWPAKALAVLLILVAALLVYQDVRR